MCKQIIYFGAPGTGKSYAVDKKTKGSTKIRVTIHPEYSYADFIGQVLPVSRGNSFNFEFVPGPMTKALIEAFENRNKAVALILEELSRGDVAAIFGDMFQLLDRGSDGVSEYPVDNDNVASQIRETEEWTSGRFRRNQIFFPANLSIYATVNLNDQNVAPMDTAFKRRFEWHYVTIDPIQSKNGSYANNPLIRVYHNSEGIVKVAWTTFYQALDHMIVDKYKGLGRNEDRQVGQFFLKFDDQDILDSYSDSPEVQNQAINNINNLIRNKLLMYLWQDVQPKGVATANSRSLFLPDIASFQDLHERSLHNQQVFSDIFFNEFLN